MRKIFAFLLISLCMVGLALAQSPTTIQQAPTKLDAASIFTVPAPATACATVNTTAANGTVTIPAVAGMSFYVTGFYLDIGSNATGTASVAVISTTGLNTNISYSLASLATATATTGLFRQIAEVYNPPVKALQSTAVVFTGPTQAAHTIFCPRVTGYYAP